MTARNNHFGKLDACFHLPRAVGGAHVKISSASKVSGALPWIGVGLRLRQSCWDPMKEIAVLLGAGDKGNSDRGNDDTANPVHTEAYSLHEQINGHSAWQNGEESASD